MPRRPVSLLRLVPPLILAVGLAVTYLAQQTARNAGERALAAEFNFRVDQVVATIERRMSNYEQVLEGAVGLFEASHAVERSEFAAYVQALQLGGKYPGIQGVGFSLLIPAREVAAHVARVRAEGFPDYHLRPEGSRDPYSSILFLEPFDWRNQRAFGYDMYSEPVRRQAMARARDEARTIISGRVRLVQETETEVQPGFLMYLPVYSNGARHGTLAERQTSLVGWVYAPFRMNDLMAGILGQQFGELSAALDLEIYDGDRVEPSALLFDANNSMAAPTTVHQAVKHLPVFGRQWTIAIRALPAFDGGQATDRAGLIAIGGSVVSVLLGLVVWLLVTARSRALAMAEGMTRELRQSETNKNALFENMSSGVAVLQAVDDGRDFLFTAYNRAAERMDRLHRTEVLGRRISEVFPGSASAGLTDVLERVWQSGVAEEVPAAFYQDERISGWREAYVYKLPDDSIVNIYNDVSARKQAEITQERLNRALRLLSDCNMALVHADDEYKLLTEICRLIVERGGYRLAWVGYADQDAARSVRPMAQSGYSAGYLEQLDLSWQDDERGQGPTGTAIRTGATTVNQDVLANPRMAPWRDAAIRHGYRSSIALPLVGDSTVLGALNMYSAEADAFNPEEVRLLEELAGDLSYGIITLRTRAAHALAQEKVSFLAHFDPLTHLPNRLLLRDRFEQALVTARADGTVVAMLYLDLDHFQQINDTLGHDAGDKILLVAAERLRHCVPATDTVSRLSGDEFVVLLSGVRDPGSIARIAESILESFREPATIDGILLNMSFSIGISVFPGDGQDFDTLLKHADTAVSSAKEAGRNTLRFYTRNMNADVLEQIRLSGRLLSALRNQEFVVYYQPQVAVASGRIIGAEALVRWQHPADGLIPPGKFIPLAEQSGHIVPIGEWVLKTACRQARDWLDRHPGPFTIAVNLSACQFQRGNVLEMVSAALASTGLPGECLELELTESILLQDVAATMKTLQGLKKIGVKLSIDDFGTGYSSLSYLKQLAVDKLKIDQSFVRDMLGDADGASIVKAIIQLGHSLQLVVIAEGVEIEAQRHFLEACGCDEIQGYLYSRPVPAEQFAGFLEHSADDSGQGGK